MGSVWVRYRLTIVVMGCLVGLLTPVVMATAQHDRRHGERAGAALSVPELLELYECSRCHRLNTPHRLIGPSLWKIGERADPDAIRASILSPDAVVTLGFPPGQMQKRLQEVGFYQDLARNPAILDRIVAYLTRAEAPARATSTAVAPRDDMVTVPAGVVRWADGQRFDIAGFEIDRIPITKRQFAVFIADGGYTTKRYWDRGGWSKFVRRRHRTQPLGWETQRDAISEDPVVGVTWYEADAYCRSIGKTLPKALEWERACIELPDWPAAPSAVVPEWEWTADSIWKGGTELPRDRLARCASKLNAYPGLEGRQTGFRCRAGVDRGAPSWAQPVKPNK